MSSSSSASIAKLKVAGTWAGLLEVETENWTVPMLREEIAKRSNMGTESINLIFAGKVLKDCTSEEKSSLSQLGIKNNSKILACRVSVEEGKTLKNELLADDERNRRLARIRAAVTALSKRHADGALPIEDFDIELEDQSGKKVHFSETDRLAIMTGLMLHTSGKRFIRKQMFTDALEVLTMGEEAFSLCNPKSIELVDNIPILQIDMVWCYFMLRDIAWIAVAGLRLKNAREGLERAHGKDSSRFRLLQAGRTSELALYLRLELLEGVVAYHSGQFDKSRKFLASAQEKFFQLQVPDEALSLVMSMGFGEWDAKRALRMSNQDIQSAVNFLVVEREKREQKREDDIRRRNEIMEQKRYGVTPLKKAVDLQRLTEVVSIGFEKELAAEALRKNENDTQKALDDLTNPEANTALQHNIELRKRRRQQRATDATIERLVSMGFERSRVIGAVQAGGSLEQAMHQLLTHSRADTTVAAENSANAHGSTVNNNASAPDSTPTDLALDNLDPDALDIDCSNEGPSAAEIEQRDVEMEGEIADELARGDALSDYDIEVAKEGEAINEYLALLASADGTSSSQSSQ
ncbi:NEDD8 ultimate buster 1-like [Populus alba x Populus x berolinensis]|uniref:NEDD8 ultimate buster 1-like n=1 Tax=Populus alba x Populus x berolinensis TaxID=444605 RepID=A0AAD6PS74_9ROSI|nr:NEDD8 ultimate buster 1-like [Populus alba x Populus x berolinensis]KAJ6958359.1 NEDD8 ultimate buster 1-like [Populus alba x Populus x berolinensis]